MTATVALAELQRICAKFPSMRRAPRRAQSIMPSPMRRLRVITLAAADGLLLVETATVRETIPATGTLAAVTVDARFLARALGLHQGETVELEHVGGLRIRSGTFRTVTPAA